MVQCGVQINRGFVSYIVGCDSPMLLSEIKWSSGEITYRLGVCAHCRRVVYLPSKPITGLVLCQICATLEQL